MNVEIFNWRSFVVNKPVEETLAELQETYGVTPTPPKSIEPWQKKLLDELLDWGNAYNQPPELKEVPQPTTAKHHARPVKRRDFFEDASPLWKEAKELFPEDERAHRPLGKSQLMFSPAKNCFVEIFTYSNGWAGGKNNLNHKKRQHYVNLTPKLNSNAWYYADYHIDHVDDLETRCRGTKESQKLIRAVQVKAQADDAMYLAYNNIESRGNIRIIMSTTPRQIWEKKYGIEFKPLELPEEWLKTALMGIRYPEDMPKGGRFKPFWSTAGLATTADKQMDENKEELILVGTALGHVDPIQIEAEAIVHGLVAEYTKEKIKRVQYGAYTLRINCHTLEKAKALLDSLFVPDSDGHQLFKPVPRGIERAFGEITEDFNPEE